MKNRLTLAGIEPATFRFVAQNLNHCATAVPKLCSARAEPRDGRHDTTTESINTPVSNLVIWIGVSTTIPVVGVCYILLFTVT